MTKEAVIKFRYITIFIRNVNLPINNEPADNIYLSAGFSSHDACHNVVIRNKIPSPLSFDRGPDVYGAYIIVGVFLSVLFLLVYLLSVFLNLSYRLQLATTL